MSVAKSQAFLVRCSGGNVLPVKWTDMQRLNEFELYELASAVHPLVSVTNESKYTHVWFHWFTARTTLAKLFQQRSLEFSYRAANELYLAIDAVVPRDWDAAVEKLQGIEADQEPEIGWAAYNIRVAAEKFETVLSAELANFDTYWISPKGTHKTSVLLTSAHLDLPASVAKDTPEAVADFDEAGRCLLFDLGTAAGFHLLRAVEAVIREYYKIVTGVEPKVKFRNWGAYIKILRKKDANPKITGFLNHIREHYRNPILHPQESLTIQEAQVLFGVCVSAITMMVGEMKALSNKSGTLPFLAAAVP